MGAIITVTAVLIGLFLVLKYSDAFKPVADSITTVYTQAVSALQGR